MKFANVLSRDILLLLLVSLLLALSAQPLLPHGLALKTDLVTLQTASQTYRIPAVSADPEGNGDTAGSIGLQAAYEAYQEQEAVLSNRLQENLTGVRVVKAFACQSHEIEKFER